MVELDYWGVRLTKLTVELDRKLQDISGIVVVVHTAASRPHYHVYWPTPKMCDKIFREKYIKPLDVKGNGDYKLKNYTEQDNPLLSFWNYTMTGYKEKTGFHHFDGYLREGASVLYWNSPTPRYPQPPTRPIPIVSSIEDVEEVKNVIVATEEKKPKAKTTQQKKQDFLNYCRKYFSENPQKDITREKIAKLLCDYWHLEVKDPSYKTAAIVYVNFVFHNLLVEAGEGKKVELKWFRNNWASSVLNLW